jgi:hypothetical protein
MQGKEQKTRKIQVIPHISIDLHSTNMPLDASYGGKVGFRGVSIAK